MIKRFFFILLSLLFFSPVFSNELDDAIKSDENLLVYLSLPNCRYCIKFDPIYKKLSEKYASECKFMKMSADTKEGQEFVRNYNVMSVPYVVVFNKKDKMAGVIDAMCLIRSSCAERVFLDFNR